MRKMRKMRNLIDRILLPTPGFWIKVSNIGVSLTGFSTAVFTVSFFGYLPGYAEEFSSHAFVVGIALTFIARFAVTDGDMYQKQHERNIYTVNTIKGEDGVDRHV